MCVVVLKWHNLYTFCPVKMYDKYTYLYIISYLVKLPIQILNFQLKL